MSVVWQRHRPSNSHRELRGFQQIWQTLPLVTAQNITRCISDTAWSGLKMRLWSLQKHGLFGASAQYTQIGIAQHAWLGSRITTV